MKNKLIKVLSLVMALTMIAGSFGTISFAADCDHANATAGEVVEPTCSAPGFTWYECPDCGEEFQDDIVPASKDHTNIKVYAATPATCKGANGKPAYTAGKYCADCQVNEDGSLKGVDKFGDIIADEELWIEVPQPKTGKDNEALHHMYVGQEVPATCEENKKLVFVCSVCGEKAEDNGHVGAYINQNNRETGETTDVTTTEVLGTSKGEHAWSQTAIVAPTLCADGSVSEVCTVCGEKRETVIVATHDFQVPNNAGNSCATVKAGGKICTVCGKVEKDEDLNEDVKHNFEADPSKGGVIITSLNQYSELTNKLIAAGYTRDSDLFKAATCKAAGFRVVKCKYCDAFEKQAIEALDHTITYTLKGGEQDANNCAKKIYIEAKCANYNTCGYKTETLIKDAVPHSWKETVEPPTCTTQGYTTRACKVCNYANGTNYNYVASLGHAFTEWTAPTKDCTAGITQTRFCTRTDCDESETKTLAAAKAEHVWSKGSQVVVVPATCTEVSYQARYCTNPYCQEKTTKAYAVASQNGTLLEEADKLEVGEDKDSANHTVAVVDVTASASFTGTNNANKVTVVVTVAGGTLLEVTKDPTCTADGKANVMCACGTQLEVVVPAYEHKPVKGGVFYVKDGKVYATNVAGSTKVDLDEFDGSCVREAQEAGVHCAYCYEVLLAAAKSEKDPDTHNLTTITGETLNAATCLEPAYTKMYCEDCKTIVKKYENANLGSHTSVAATAEDGVGAATCAKAGKYDYNYCSTCKIVLEVIPCTSACDKDSNGQCIDPAHQKAMNLKDPTIPQLAHEWAEELVEEIPETCTEIGWTEHKVCTLCGATEGKKSIPAHGNKFVTVYEEEDATCTTDGYKFTSYATVVDDKVKACSKCQVSETVTAETLVQVLSATGHDATEHYITLNHVDGEKDGKVVDCTKPVVVINKCNNDKCNYLVAVSYTAPKAEHNYALNWTEIKLSEDGKTIVGGDHNGAAACLYPTYKYVKCINCEEKKTENEKAPVAHYYYDNGVKTEISLSCANIDKFIGTTCELCHKTFTENDVQHNTVTKIQYATCGEDGYVIESCKDCRKQITIGTLGADNREFNPYEEDGTTINDEIVASILEKVDATEFADGYILWTCKNKLKNGEKAEDVYVCGETHKYIIKAAKKVALELDVEDKVVTAGGQLTVTVNISAKDFNFNTFMFEFANNYGLTVAENGVNVVYDFGGQLVSAKASTGTSDFLGKNVTTVLVYVPNDVETAKPVNAVLNGENKAFVTITFDVLPNAYGNAFYNGIYDVFEYAFVDENGDVVSATIDADKYTSIASTDEYNDYKIGLKGDANADTYLDAADSTAIMSAIYSGTFDVNVDFDNNGVIDLADHVAFLKYYTTFAPTQYDYYKLLGIDLAAYVNAYDLYVDLTGDKLVSEADYNLVLAKVVEKLKNNYMHENADAIDVVVNDVVTNLINGIY